MNKRLKLIISNVFENKKKVCNLTGVRDWVLSLKAHVKMSLQLRERERERGRKKAANSNQPL